MLMPKRTKHRKTFRIKYEGKDGKYSVSMDVDMEKIEEAYEGEVSEETTIEDLKESFEEQHYTCTIK